MWLLVLASACRWFETWDRCDEADCRARTVETGFREDPHGVLNALRKMGDPIEQVALVEQLALAFPQMQGDICSVTTPGSPGAQRCQHLMLRPHLYELQHLTRVEDRTVSRAGAGPTESTPPLAGLPPPWTDDPATREAARGPCAEDRTCISDRSRALALEGQAAAAGLGCALAWPEGSAARAECLFVAAEATILAGGFDRLRDALALCGAAEAIGRNCTQHVLIEAIPEPPPADAPELARVQAATQAAASFQDWPEPQRSFYTQFFWAIWTRDAFASANTITGHLLRAVPAEAAPHVRSAAAWSYAQREGGSFQNLEEVAQQLKQLLDIGGPFDMYQSEGSASPFRVTQSQPNAFWTSDAGELEAAVPSILFIGSGRRARATDPMDGLRIAVLESAARTSPPVGRDFLYNAMDASYSMHVRWTAARLLATLYGEAVVQQNVRSDVPLIQQGLNYAYNRAQLR